MENQFDGVTCEGQMMRCLARVPDLMQRGRKIRGREAEDPNLLDEIRTNYGTFKTILKELSKRLAVIQNLNTNEASESAPVVQAHAHYLRSYALGLTFAVILNGVLSAIDNEDTELTLESTSFAKEILALAEPAARYRPTGASYMGLCLMAAWIGTTDYSIRSVAETALVDYQGDFPQGKGTVPIAVLEQIYEKLHLLDANLANDSI